MKEPSQGEDSAKSDLVNIVVPESPVLDPTREESPPDLGINISDLAQTQDRLA